MRRHDKQGHARADCLIPAALLALTLVPMLGGAVRIASFAGGEAAITPDNARFLADPVPLLVHIVASLVFCLLGAFQFSPGLRRRHIGWHRLAGRVVVGAGLLSALSALWMTLFYPKAPASGELLYGIRLAFGTAMLVGLCLGLAAVLRRDIPTHRAWMIRAYAIGQGAGTQVFTFLPFFILVGIPSGFATDMLMLAGWAINVVVAEWVVRRKPTGRRVGTPLAGQIAATATASPAALPD